MEIGNYKKNPLKVSMCLWGGVERKASCVLCLQAGGFQNEVLLSSGRRLTSEKVASVLADAIFEDCWPHMWNWRGFFKGHVSILWRCYTSGWTRISNKADLPSTC